MANNYLDTVTDMFKDVSSFTPEKMQAFVEETTSYLTDLKERFESNDPLVQEGALKMVAEVQAGLQRQVEGLLAQAGVDPKEVSALLTEELSPERQEILSQAETQFAKIFPKEEATRPSNRPKTNKIKLVG